jgi:ZIP family zinc transporter
MPTALISVLTFAAIPAAAVIAGGILAAVRTPSPAMRSAVQHIAAGVLFAALATELLPDIIHRRTPLVTLGGFALGVVAMLALKAATGRSRRTREARR